MTSPVVTPEDVLESLMNDGTIDAIRLKIINQLKANEELKNNTITMVEQSNVLNTPGAERKTKRELFDALRRELETPVLEKASKSVWELILDNDGLGKEISEMVEKVYCRLSGHEPPLLPSSNGDVQIETGKEKGKEKENLASSSAGKEQENSAGKEKENWASSSAAKEKENSAGKEKDSLASSSKKRTISEMNMEGAGEIVDGSTAPSVISEDSATVPSSKLKA
ncbi:antigenic heat-stable protein [Tasmannia lanceolata]|uniref:antigenic heat-stable protein n=1 Tax=Tasmannia lanceolata TaxID=3420 RepID=UPI004062BD4A